LNPSGAHIFVFTTPSTPPLRHSQASVLRVTVAPQQGL